jgi:hypothetical protein
MADRKISDLTALTTPASGDYLPIVDISEAAAASKNKRITIEELMRGVPDGTAAAPGIAFETDPNTGIFSPGADQLAISTGGTGRLFVDASGNVGIATASPGTKLHVNGPVKIGEGVATNTSKLLVNTLAGTAAGIQLFQDATESWIIQNPASSADLTFGASGTERARITSAGLVGIGTSTFSYLANKLVIDKGSTVNDGITIVSSNTSNACIWFADGTTGSEAYRGGIDYNHSTDKMQIYTGGLGNITIDSAGRLGIGTTSPSTMLQIGNSATAGLSVAMGGVGYQTIFRNGANEDNYITQGASGFTLFRNHNGSEYMRLDSSGRLGIGTSTPQLSIGAVGGNVLHLAGVGTTGVRVQNTSGNSVEIYAGTDGFINQSGSGTLNFQLAGSTKATLTSTGLGIGVTSPTEKLHVGGNAIFKATNSYIGLENASGTSTGYIQGQSSFLAIAGGSGSSNTIAFYPASTEALRMVSSGNVGIGTTSPNLIGVNANSRCLSIVGDGTTTNARGTLELRNPIADAAGITLGSIYFNGGAAAINYAEIRAVSSGTGGANGFGNELRFATKDDNGAHYTKMVLTSTGNLGIGTTNPLTKLDVRSGAITAGGDAPSGGEILRGYYSGGGAITVMGSEYSSGGPVIGYGVKPSTSAMGAFFSSTSITGLSRGAYTIAGNEHKWYVGAVQTVAENSSVTMSEVMRIDPNGNFGIGTVSPGAKLHTVGKIRFGSNITYYGEIDHDASVTGANIYNSIDTGGHIFQRNGNEMLRIAATGNVGIGTTGPSTTLEVRKGGTNTVSGSLFNAGFTQTIVAGEPQTCFISNINDQGASGSTEVARGGIGFSWASVSDRTRFIVGTNSNHPLRLYTNASEKVRITESGILDAKYGVVAPIGWVYQNTYTANSTWSSGWQTIIPNGICSFGTYVVSLYWNYAAAPSAGLPYYITASTIFTAVPGTNGTGTENAVALLSATHTGGTGAYLQVRTIAFMSGTTGLQVNIVNYTAVSGTIFTVYVQKIGY